MKTIVLVIGLLSLAAPAVAEPANLPRDAVSLASVTCADLRDEVRARLAECAPVRAAPVRKAKAQIGQRSFLIAQDQSPVRVRKLTRMPWMIGVFQ